MTDRQHWLDQVPAYVLGSLSEEEVRVFESALAQSGALQSEVTRYREVQALLGLSHGVEPPRDLRDRVLARVRRERSAASPAIVPLRRRTRGVAWVGLAAGLALVVWLGRENLRLRDSLVTADSALAHATARLEDRERLLNAILEPGVQLVQLSATGDQPPGIQVFRNRQTGSAILSASRLPPAPSGRAYQLWLIRDGVPVPSQVFNSRPDGSALVEGIPVPAEQVDAFAVTEEPEAGSPRPTGPILLFGRVPSD